MNETLAAILHRQRRHLEQTERLAWALFRLHQKDAYYRACVAAERRTKLFARIESMYGVPYWLPTQMTETY